MTWRWQGRSPVAREFSPAMMAVPRTRGAGLQSREDVRILPRRATRHLGAVLEAHGSAGVPQAAWRRPNIRSMAVVRTAAGRSRVEYPIGTVLFQTAGRINCVRVAPAGDAVAFLRNRQADTRDHGRRRTFARIRPAVHGAHVRGRADVRLQLLRDHLRPVPHAQRPRPVQRGGRWFAKTDDLRADPSSALRWRGCCRLPTSRCRCATFVFRNVSAFDTAAFT